MDFEKFPCPYCEDVYNTRIVLRRHINRHHWDEVDYRKKDPDDLDDFDEDLDDEDGLEDDLDAEDREDW